MALTSRYLAAINAVKRIRRLWFSGAATSSFALTRVQKWLTGRGLNPTHAPGLTLFGRSVRYPAVYAPSRKTTITASSISPG